MTAADVTEAYMATNCSPKQSQRGGTLSYGEMIACLRVIGSITS